MSTFMRIVAVASLSYSLLAYGYASLAYAGQLIVRIRNRDSFRVDGSKSVRELSRLQFLRALRHHHSAVWEQHGRSGEWFVLRSLRRQRTRDTRLAPDIYRSGACIVGSALVQSLRQ